MKRRLLIVCDPYGKPSFGPRIRYLSDYLNRKGWEIDVYTEQWDELCFEHAYPITEIAIYRGPRGSLLYKIDWTLKSIWSLLTDWKNRYFNRRVRKLTQGKTFDAILCTTFSTFPLPAAQALASEMQLPLFCDLRDIDEQVGGTQYQQHRNWWTMPFRKWYSNVQISRRNNAIRKAKRITTVSPWHVDFLKQFHPSVHLIYNGFDPSIHYFKPISTERFIICYLGRLYEPTSQDPTLLMQALGEIAHEMPELQLLIHTDANGQERLRDMAIKYGVKADIHGYISIDAVPELYRKSSICLVFSNKAEGDGPKGMMTTKFFEIVGSEKPLLLVRSDEAHLAEAIRKTNAGLAAENKEQIIRFIREKYSEWKQHGFTHQPINKNVVSLFNREVESAQFEQLLLS